MNNKNVYLSKIELEDQISELIDVLIKIKDKDTCKNLLDDLCTYKEVEQMAQRVVSARLLIEGCTYEEVIEKTGISSATLSRVSKCVKYGKGYNSIIKK